MDVIPQEKKKQPSSKKRFKAEKKINLSGKASYNTKNVKGNSKRKRIFPKKGKGVIYLGHIPHGFYEDEMRSYFEQFGKVLHTTVARSSKTGRSKGYGFVEFEDEEVAQIAAETMNNYLMFNKIIKCRYIPAEERKERIVVKTTMRHDYPRKRNRIKDLEKKTNNFLSLDKESYMKKTEKKINEFKKFFQDRGIDFTFKFNKETKENKVTKANDVQKNNNAEDNVSDSEAEIETDDQFVVLEIDESDNDIHFTTPPQAKKVIKRSLNSQGVNLKEFNDFINDAKIKNEIKQKRAKSLVSKKNQKKTTKLEKKKQKSKIGVSGLSKNNHKSKVKNKKTVANSKKIKLIKKDISTLMNVKNKNNKGNIDIVVSKIVKGDSRTKLKKVKNEN